MELKGIVFAGVFGEMRHIWISEKYVTDSYLVQIRNW